MSGADVPQTPSGERLCSIADLDATGAKGITLGEWPQAREFVVVRDGDTIRAFKNRCPHNSGTSKPCPTGSSTRTAPTSSVPRTARVSASPMAPASPAHAAAMR